MASAISCGRVLFDEVRDAWKTRRCWSIRGSASRHCAMTDGFATGSHAPKSPRRRCPPPVVDHEGDVLEVHREQQLLQVRGVVHVDHLEGRLVRPAEAERVHGDDACALGERPVLECPDDLPVRVRALGLPWTSTIVGPPTPSPNRRSHREIVDVLGRRSRRAGR